MNHTPRTLAAIATVSLLAAFAAQANKGADYKPHHAKEHHKNFFITAGATYLEPSYNGLDYAQYWDQNAVAPANAFVTSETIEPEFGWGYFIQAGYRISHHYDIQASWAQYNSNITDSNTVAGTSGKELYVSTSNADYFEALTSPSQTNYAHSKQTIDYSVFDANLGQYHNITEMLRTRIFAGINYAKVDASTHNYYSQPSDPNDPEKSDSYSSTFNGWGPEVGMDLEYKIWRKIGVVGHFAASFLIGQLDADSNVYENGFGQISGDGDETVRMVPALEAKLGLNWNVPYAYEKVAFGIEGGYQVAYYWDVVDQMQIPAYSETIQHNYENYGNMGPYLNFTAMF